MENTELPSEERMGALRAAGIVPYSSAAVFFCSLSACALWSVIRREKLSEISLLARGDGLADFHLAQNLEAILLLIPEVVGVAMIGAVIAGLLQTQFLILTPFGTAREALPPRALVRNSSFFQLMTRQAAALVGIAVGVVLLSSFIGFFLGLFRLEEGRIPGAVLNLFDLVVKGTALLAIPIALLLFLLERFHFRSRYRMTREELRQEER